MQFKSFRGRPGRKGYPSTPVKRIKFWFKRGDSYYRSDGSVRRTARSVSQMSFSSIKRTASRKRSGW